MDVYGMIKNEISVKRKFVELGIFVKIYLSYCLICLAKTALSILSNVMKTL